MTSTLHCPNDFAHLVHQLHKHPSTQWLGYSYYQRGCRISFIINMPFAEDVLNVSFCFTIPFYNVYINIYIHTFASHCMLFCSPFNHEKTEPKERMMGQVAMANTCLDSELLQHPSGIALEADMIFTSPNLSTASFNLLQNFHSSKSTKPQIPQETDSGTAPLKCLSRSATRMVATVFQDKWAMSTGLGSTSNAGGCQFEQNYPKPASTSFSF